MRLAQERRPDLIIDGEMQADVVVGAELLARMFSFNRLGGAANVLIFPELVAANVAYKLLDRLGGTKTVGPLLMGLTKPFNVLQRGTDMENGGQRHRAHRGPGSKHEAQALALRPVLYGHPGGRTAVRPPFARRHSRFSS